MAIRSILALVSAAGVMLAPVALAQDATQPAAQPAPAQPAGPAAPKAPKPVDPQIEAIAKAMVGSWKTMSTDPASSQPAELWLHIAPLTVDGLDNTFYAETAWGSSLFQPFRQVVYQLYRYKGNTIRLRTLTFKKGERPGILAGWWAAPKHLAQITADDLQGTLDIDLTPTSNGGWTGRSPYPFPTSIGGAVEMVSQITIAATGMTTQDRGFDADGKAVWGSEAKDTLSWARGDAGWKVTERDDGIVLITMAHGTEGREAQDQDTVYINYTGWMTDGTQLETTRRQGAQPYPAVLPFQGIKGWDTLLRGIQKGTHYRFLLPPALGFGENQQGPIPPNSTLYFEMEAMAIVEPAAPAVDPLAPPAGPQGPASPGAPSGGGADGSAPSKP